MVIPYLCGEVMKVEQLFSNRNIILVATLAFAVWILFFDRNNYLDSLALDRKIEEMEAEKAFYLRRITEDSVIISGLKDSAFLERFAREQYHFSRPGEAVYLIEEK